MEEEPRKSPLWYIMALFLMFILFLSIVPHYAVKRDPWPKVIPTIDDILPDHRIGVNKTQNLAPLEDFLSPHKPIVKQVATRIATIACDSNILCQAKAEFYFVRDNFIYVAELDEYIQSPEEMLATRGGDCDDHAVLVANLVQAIGIPSRFVHVPRHVYVEIYIQDAPKKYQQKDGWIALDPTCKSCEFGELPYKYTDYS